MKLFSVDCELQYDVSQQTVFMLNVAVPTLADQTVLAESITAYPSFEIEQLVAADSSNRILRADIPPGSFGIRYLATVEIDRAEVDRSAMEVPVGELPPEVLPYLTPSRYCESDVLFPIASREFGQVQPGYPRVEAICDWLHQRIVYRIGSSHAQSTASDVLNAGAGVCRDFAHIGISFCRALNIPARFVTGYAQYEEPPADFHAAMEVYLGGQWILFDPSELSPMADLVKIGTGRDASEVPFSTFFGAARLRVLSPLVATAQASSRHSNTLTLLQQPGDGILLVA